MDLQRRRVERVERTVFRDLVLHEKTTGEPDPDLAWPSAWPDMSIPKAGP
jgi:hypothetical protein